jgi:hypothetical protein
VSHINHSGLTQQTLETVRVQVESNKNIPEVIKNGLGANNEGVIMYQNIDTMIRVLTENLPFRPRMWKTKKRYFLEGVRLSKQRAESLMKDKQLENGELLDWYKNGNPNRS